MKHSTIDRVIIDGVNIGYLLPGSYFTEQERGIRSLLESFGIAQGHNYVEDRKIKKDATITFAARQNKTKNLYITTKTSPEDKKYVKTCTAFIPRNDEFSACWDDRNFAIRGIGESGCKAIKELKAHMENNNIAIWMASSGNLFSNSGIFIGFYDKLPEDFIKEINQNIDEIKSVKSLSDNIGIIQKIDSSDKSYYALSPRMANIDELNRTEHPIVYWLNPIHQNAYNYGWFTVEELEQWIDDKGPIIKA